MDVLALVVLLNSRIGIAEVDMAVADCEAISRYEGRVGPDNRDRVRFLQMRVAEEFRALVWPDLADAMTRWALDPRVTEYLFEAYVGDEIARSFDEAIPSILERMALEVQRTYSDFASDSLFEE